MTLAIDYNVQGVVYAIDKYCFPYQQDRPPVVKYFRQKFIPLHEIEHDGTIHGAEFVNRIEAFIESIRAPVTANV